MKKFIPKQFLNGEITQDTCDHELLSTSGFDEGMYGTSYTCLICGKYMHYGVYEKPDIKGKYIFKDYGFLTLTEKELILNLLTVVSKSYPIEEAIDIVAIFNKISKDIHNMSLHIGPSASDAKTLIHRK